MSTHPSYPRPRAASDQRRRSSEGGFVLMTLLFFAAVAAFMLVMALPRSAMQSQRVREETLIYRGEQYKRAVQLYFRKYQKYPQSLDDLEESDGIRFLRRRYKDPLTGEDEWRLVHMGSDGRFKDSLLFDKEEEEGQGQGARGFGGMAAGRVTIGGQPGVTTAFRGADRARTARDSAAPDIAGQQASAADYLAAGFADQVPPDGAEANAAGQQQPQDGAVPYPNYAGTLPSQIPSATGAGRMAPPGTVNPYPAAVAGVAPGTMLPTNQQSVNRGGGRQGQLVRNPAGVGGIPPQGQPGSPGRSAADLIRNLLTTPRPGGLAGLRGAQEAAQGNRPNFAEGIAGVASKVEERGVKVYNERELYNEWEFVYDYRQDASLAGIPGAGAGGMGNLNPGQPGLGPGGSLQIDPSQTGVTPGMPGMMPGAVMPGAAPGDGTQIPYPQMPGAPQPPGTSPFDPVTGAPYPQADQPGQPAGADRSNRGTRRLRYPVPLPGQPIYPTGANDPTQPTTAPGQQTPFGLPQPPPPDPNQPQGSPDNGQQP